MPHGKAYWRRRARLVRRAQFLGLAVAASGGVDDDQAELESIARDLERSGQQAGALAVAMARGIDHV